MNGIDDYFKQYFGGQQQGQQQGYGQYPYRERMPKAPKYPYGMGQQSYGYQGFGQKPPQQPMGGQMPRLPGQRLFGETIDSKRQNLMQQYQMQYPKQPTVPSPASQMAKPPAIMHVQEPSQGKDAYGNQFASVFAKMVKPTVYSPNAVQDAKTEYQSYEKYFNKIGPVYFQLKNDYADMIEKDSGVGFDTLFYEYIKSFNPNYFPFDMYQPFFDWYKKRQQDILNKFWIDQRWKRLSEERINRQKAMAAGLNVGPIDTALYEKLYNDTLNQQPFGRS